MARGAQGWVQVLYERIDFKGGLDQLTPTLNLPPGVVRDALNFEVSITGGYTRILGYERYDGHPSPSTNTYLTMQLTTLGAIANGVSISGATSGTTAVCTGTNPAVLPNVVAYSNVVGPGFMVGEVVNAGVAPQGTVVALEVPVTDPYTAAFFADESGDSLRSTISPPPGSGPTRGVFYLNGTLYAFRDNAGATVENLWMATAAGWVQVPYGYEVLYTAGTGTRPAVGSTLVGGTSGVSGVISAVINETGVVTVGNPAWSPSTGRFILSSVTGTYTPGEALKVSGSQVATAGATYAIAPNPGGIYVIDVNALGGGTTFGNCAYGASGVDRMFSFDGTVYVPITTGSVPDTPSVARVHLNYLTCLVLNNLQISGLGLPFQWTPLSGGAAIVLNSNGTNLIPLPGNQATGALGIFTTDHTYILYGTSQTNFQLVPYNIKAGAIFGTVTNLADTYIFETRGITSLTTTLQYGNFDPAYLTMPIKPFIDLHRPFATCAIANRTKSQYRVFFSDGYALWATFLNKQFAGSMPVFFPQNVRCVCDGVDPTTGGQRIFFGSDNGMVYEMDKGTSFDGTPILAYLQFVFDSMKSHRVIKRFRKLSLEVAGNSFAPISFSYQLSYNQTTTGQPTIVDYEAPFLQSAWDSFRWDAFVWDGLTLAPVEMELTGSAENIALYLVSNTDVAQPFTINTATIHYSIRRGLR